MATIYMETTKISVNQTISEIQIALATAGANRIMIDYVDGEPQGITFSIQCSAEQGLSYKLPVKIDCISSLIKRNDLAQAKRVGWRQVLRWIQAQLALIEVGMADIKEVFLPYCYDGKKTVYELFAEDYGIKLLE